MIVSFNIVFQNPRRVKRFRERVAARAGERGKSCPRFPCGRGSRHTGKRYKKAQPCSAAPFCRWKRLCATEVKKFIGAPPPGACRCAAKLFEHAQPALRAACSGQLLIPKTRREDVLPARKSTAEAAAIAPTGGLPLRGKALRARPARASRGLFGSAAITKTRREDVLPASFW